MNKETSEKLHNVLLNYSFFKNLIESYDKEEGEKPRVEYINRIRPLVKQIDRIVKAMPAREKEVITKRYFHIEARYTEHLEVCRSMGLGQSNYSRIRKSAFNKLAMIFEE